MTRPKFDNPNDESPEAYLSRKGIKFKKQGGRNVRFECPFCGRNSSFDMNLATGQYWCKAASCDSKGNLITLQQHWGDIYEVQGHSETTLADERRNRLADALSVRPDSLPDVSVWRRSLRESPDAQEAREYLSGRLLGDETLKVARVGWSQNHPKPKNKPRPSVKPNKFSKGKPWAVNGMITIPYFHNGGTDPVMVKLRTIPPEPTNKDGKPVRYMRVAGGESILYAPLGLDTSKTVVILGGELDALSIIEMMHRAGYEPDHLAGLDICIVSVVNGENWSDIWTEQLKDAEDIIIALDSDRAGRLASDKFSGELGRHRCRTLKWPEGSKDANDALKAGMELREFVELTESAESSVAAGLKSPSDMSHKVCQKLFGGTEGSGYPTAFKQLDRLLGGWRGGEVTVVTGHTGAGKSTLTNFMLMKFVKDVIEHEGGYVFIHPAELGVRNHLIKMLKQEYGRSPYSMDEETVCAGLKLFDNKYLMLDVRGAVDPESYRSTLLYVARRFRVKMALSDHLQWMARVSQSSKKWDQLVNLSTVIQEVAEEVDWHHLLVEQPGKTGDGRNKDDAIVQLGDVLGPADLTQKHANGASAYRPREADRGEEQDMLREHGHTIAGLVLLKNREFGREGVVDLLFDPETERYSEPSDTPQDERPLGGNGKLEWWHD